jgi:hypothetical protein
LRCVGDHFEEKLGWSVHVRKPIGDEFENEQREAVIGIGFIFRIVPKEYPLNGHLKIGNSAGCKARMLFAVEVRSDEPWEAKVSS